MDDILKQKIDNKIKLLLKEGATTKCEDGKNVENIENLDLIPEWFDEEKFKRGQKFFHDHIFGMLLAKFCGLIVIISIKSIGQILKHTKMSSTALTAYKRYISTIFHMYVWYDKDFKPGSKLWRSLTEVRNKHNSASRMACKGGLNFISQKDMALTQFGFMGFVMTKPDMVGVYETTDEDLEGFIHVWRVIGHLLGMEDRFNLCTGNVEETKALCNQLVKDVFTPALYDIDKDFEYLVRTFMTGLWSFNPMIEYEVFMIYICKLCDIKRLDNNNKELVLSPTSYTPYAMWILNAELYLYKFYIFKVILNYMEYLSLWLIENFPFLAYYHFGVKNSYVRILNNEGIRP